MHKFQKGDVWAVVLILLFTLLFFRRIILHIDEMIFPAYDVTIYHLWKSFWVDSTLQFKSFPLWNPYLFSGAPFVANSQVAIFYPINVLYFFSKVELIFGWIFIIDIFLIGIGSYFFARTIQLSIYSSIISAVIMMFSGTIIVRLIPGHIPIVDGIAWFPVLFLLYEKSLQSNKLIYGFFAAIPLALMMLSGNMQVATYSLLAIGIYCVLRYFIDKKEGNTIKAKTLFLISLISISIAVFLSAVQLIPTNELVKLSIRKEGLSFDFASDFSPHPYQTLTFVFPHFFGTPFDNTFWGKGNFWEACAYLGILPLILMIIALLFQRKKYTITFFLLMIFAYLFSLGRYGPFFGFFYKFVPFFDNFRVPSRFLFVYAFSLSILAGIGMQYLTSQEFLSKHLKKVIPILIGGLFLASFFTAGILLKTNNSWYEQQILRNSFAVGINHHLLYAHFINDLIFFLFIFTLIVIVFILINVKKNFHIFFKIVFLLIIIFDLWNFEMKFFTTKKPVDVYPITKEMHAIKKDKGIYRIFDQTGSLPGENINVLTGYDPLILKSYQNFLWLTGPHEKFKYESFFSFKDITNIKILKLLNTKYIISSKPVQNKDIEEIYAGENFVYKINSTYPRAFVIPNAKIISDSKQVLKTLQNKDFNPEEYVLLTKDPHLSLKNEKNTTQVTIIKYNPDTIELFVAMKDSGYLLLSEIFYPGWKAYDNGKEVEIYAANYILRSLPLQEGKHAIVFTYQPMSFTVGIIISFITLSLYIIYSILYIKFYKMKSKFSTNKHLDKVHREVPGNYYHEALRTNIFQRFWHSQRINTIKEVLPKNSVDNILDVGCHGGRLTIELKKKFPKAKIYGIDISNNAILFAKKKYKNISFVIDRAEKLSFQSSTFDLVTCFEVLEHVPQPNKVLEEIKRVLKKNGHVLILVPSENILFRVIWYLWTRLGPGRVWHHTHVQKFDNNKMDELIEKNGFEIKKRKLFMLHMLLLIYAVKK